MAPSAHLQRAQAAIKAMKLIGFDQTKAKKVLKKLLKVYENNWEYIEAENYRLLADSILDDQESMDCTEANEIDATASGSPELSNKRLRCKQDDSGHLPSPIETVIYGETLLKKPKLICSSEGHLSNSKGKMIKQVPAQISHEGEGTSLLPHSSLKNGSNDERMPQINVPCFEKSKPAAVLMHDRDKHQLISMSGNLECYKDPKIEYDAEMLGDTLAVGFSSISDMPDEVASNSLYNYDAPIALLPSNVIPFGTTDNHGAAWKGDFLCDKASNGLTGANRQDAPMNENEVECFKVSTPEMSMPKLSNVFMNTDLASSNMGEVKLTLSYSSDCPDFKTPSIESVFKMVEDRCLKSYKILQPDFSLMNLMKEICQCAVDLATESSKADQENTRTMIPMFEPLKKIHSPSVGHRMTRRSSSASLDLDSLEISRQNINGLKSSQNANVEVDDKQENSAPEASGHGASQNLAIVLHQEHAVSALHPPHDEHDIAKGEERVQISLINEINSEKFPSYFHYIPRNAVYQNAHVNFSLARIGDEDCCLNCFGDCLSALIPCACTRETGGEFVYTLDGLLKKEFLNECISMNCYPDKHHHIYCKDCPIEKSKNEHMPDPCKGHLVRKFIKECWSKCGCNKQCGNRVVQRGISRNLQVFFSADVKGWGLRTLEELPRGAFICEYVGEILTNIELYDRTIQKTGGAKHTYPVLLDADWGSEAGLRDEEALCLDATFYGNVGRFVNHRCFDANLVEVPVEWETPDHHYYHLAFFTTRKVEPLEELTWDYGIDFDDRSHPIKAFKCLCGSRFCRDKGRTRTSYATLPPCMRSMLKTRVWSKELEY